MADPTVRLAPPAPETEGSVVDHALEFDIFFEREKGPLFRALCLVTRNRFEAEELTQDAFFALYERWDRVRTMDDPR